MCVLMIGMASMILSADEFPEAEALPEIAGLPDPFLMMDGRRVTTPEQWYTERQPELKRLFQHYMYGYTPEAPEIEAKVTQYDDGFMGGAAVMKQVEIKLGREDTAPVIHLALFLPSRGKPVPRIFLAINRCGNHRVHPFPGIAIQEGAYRPKECEGDQETTRGAEADFWCIEYLIQRGYGFATFQDSDIDPDKDDFTDGVHAYFKNVPGPQESQWGTIAAWAWGISRSIDYLAADKDVDAKRICVTGHSRRGKTALLAAAMDERIALVVPHQSGTGGMALGRGNDQETVERINRVFPHWFNDTFAKFNDNESRLPIDQHLLVALVAPRPLLDTAGLQDTWANYESGLRNLKAADAVYKFLGAKGLVGEGVLTNAQITRENSGSILQYRLDTKHTMNQDYWKAILDFADIQLPKAK